MFVSIIVPVYNDPKGISIVLEKLINQSFPKKNYEIIIIDNNSTDNTSEIIERYYVDNSDLIKIGFEKKQSSYAARNAGIRIANGDILGFTDSDCIPEYNWIENAVFSLKNSNVVCGGGQIKFTFKEIKPNIYEIIDSTRKLNQKSYIESAGFAATANFFIKKNVIEKYGFFCPNLISGGDYEFGRRITESGQKMLYMENAVIYHPARYTFKQILKKTKRVALGQKELSKDKSLKHGYITWRSFIPIYNFSSEYNISFFKRIKIIFFLNIYKYINLIIRIMK